MPRPEKQLSLGWMRIAMKTSRVEVSSTSYPDLYPNYQHDQVIGHTQI